MLPTAPQGMMGQILNLCPDGRPSHACLESCCGESQNDVTPRGATHDIDLGLPNFGASQIRVKRRSFRKRAASWLGKLEETRTTTPRRGAALRMSGAHTGSPPRFC